MRTRVQFPRTCKKLGAVLCVCTFSTGWQGWGGGGDGGRQADLQKLNDQPLRSAEEQSLISASDLHMHIYVHTCAYIPAHTYTNKYICHIQQYIHALEHRQIVDVHNHLDECQNIAFSKKGHLLPDPVCNTLEGY